ILSTGILRVAGEKQAGRSIDEYLAMDVLSELVQIEVFQFAAVIVWRQIWLPPEAVIQGQSGTNLPTVLDIQGIVELTVVESVDSALIKGRREAHHKVTQDQTCSGSIEICRAHRIDAGPIVQSLLENGSAEP